MGELFLISGTGHCGTKWISKALNQPKAGIVCWHEGKVPTPFKGKKILDYLKKKQWIHEAYRKSRRVIKPLDFAHNTVIAREGWHELEEYERVNGVGPYYDPYFESLRNRMDEYTAVGDSHSWDYLTLPRVNAEIKISTVVHLVRNGIQVVDSYAKFDAWRPEDHPTFKYFLKVYADKFGGTYTNSWQNWCFWWSLNNKVPGWMRENLPYTKIPIMKLEDLTSGTETLTNLMESLAPGSSGKIRNVQGIVNKDVNRKMSGDRSPENIWSQWTDEKREDFLRICGNTMRDYDYPLP